MARPHSSQLLAAGQAQGLLAQPFRQKKAGVRYQVIDWVLGLREEACLASSGTAAALLFSWTIRAQLCTSKNAKGPCSWARSWTCFVHHPLPVLPISSSALSDKLGARVNIARPGRCVVIGCVAGAEEKKVHECVDPGNFTRKSWRLGEGTQMERRSGFYVGEEKTT